MVAVFNFDGIFLNHARLLAGVFRFIAAKGFAVDDLLGAGAVAVAQARNTALSA